MSTNRTIVRSVAPGSYALRSKNGKPRTLYGWATRFDEWTKIDSTIEGTFMERVAPTAFNRQLAQGTDGIRILFQHGRDPQIGDKPIAALNELRAEPEGAYYEAEMLDASYVNDLLPGLAAGVYGSSFRFQVLAERMNSRPGRSSHNPDGLPERTVTDLKLFEFGPVTFPAYAGATAGVRSLTNQLLAARSQPRKPRRRFLGDEEWLAFLRTASR